MNQEHNVTELEEAILASHGLLTTINEQIQEIKGYKNNGVKKSLGELRESSTLTLKLLLDRLEERRPRMASYRKTADDLRRFKPTKKKLEIDLDNSLTNNEIKIIKNIYFKDVNNIIYTSLK